MKIYTKTGDDGTTSLFDGTRVSKDDLRVDVYGEVDELNAFLGVARASTNDNELQGLLLTIQRDLFALGAQLANPVHKKQKAKADFDESKIIALEQAIDAATTEIGPITSFILPGGSISSTQLEYARTVCRRTERKLTHLSKIQRLNPQYLIYLNRLSDLLFMLARVANKRLGFPETPWK